MTTQANPTGPDFGGAWIEIFRAGDYGAKGSYTTTDLDRLVASYNPQTHEAPACIGHPQENAPAYAWVKGLRRDGDVLSAQFQQTDPDFQNLVLSGKYKKRSVAFYRDADGRPSVLRHVGFLGAQPPEVKGLKNLTFNDAERSFVAVEFGEEEVVAEKTVAEQVRDYLSELFGGKRPETAPAFSEADLKRSISEAVTAAIQPYETKIASLESDLKTQAAQFSEQQATATQVRLEQAASDAVQALKSAGRWVPAFDKIGVPALFNELAKANNVVEFGEGDKKQSKKPLDLLLTVFTELPKIVPSGHLVTGQATTKTGSVQFTEGRGVVADQNSIALNDLASSRAREKGISFSEALDQVAIENPTLTVPGSLQGAGV